MLSNLRIGDYLLGINRYTKISDNSYKVIIYVIRVDWIDLLSDDIGITIISLIKKVNFVACEDNDLFTKETGKEFGYSMTTYFSLKEFIKTNPIDYLFQIKDPKLKFDFLEFYTPEKSWEVLKEEYSRIFKRLWIL